ncbi:uncharacterized protein LOC128954471 [Oppia nitens]|uniref:uncharacterized protein LOC128954471 n=1 Tax=Oppia nitens TaxID=1686743 RepID=UPI0023DA4460|nr:uncharacterized protein LOC128954471 [Oppia nitens]
MRVRHWTLNLLLVQLLHQIYSTSRSSSVLSAPAICPPAYTVYPCDCSTRLSQFNCGKTISSNLVLKQIFQESSRQLIPSTDSGQPSVVIYEKFQFQNSIVDSIESDTLDRYAFRELAIDHNDYLETIHTEAFKSTYGITDRVVLEANPSLGRRDDSVDQLFRVLSQFLNASLIHVVDCGLKYIPADAFRQISGPQSRLRRLSLANNRIGSIGDRAFSQLPSISYLSLQNNLIDRLDPQSLTFSDPHVVRDSGGGGGGRAIGGHLFIDLSKNRLNSTSFRSGSLLAIGRPYVDLQLSDNLIDYLNESLVKPLFKLRSVTLKLWRNPINCSDCRMRWTTAEKHCGGNHNNNLTISYGQRIDFQCRLFKDNFRHS